METTVTKNLLKKQMLTLRNRLCAGDINSLSEQIFERVFSLDRVKKAKNIFIYRSFKNEVSTHNAVNELLKTKKVYLPRINTDDVMEAVNIGENTVYICNRYGITEPAGGAAAEKGIIDVCITPGIVFDLFGGRTGYGKAYYDIFLRGTDIYKIGVCFDFQLIEYIPVDLLDVDMDCIITEKRTIIL